MIGKLRNQISYENFFFYSLYKLVENPYVCQHKNRAIVQSSPLCAIDTYLVELQTLVRQENDVVGVCPLEASNDSRLPLQSKDLHCKSACKKKQKYNTLKPTSKQAIPLFTSKTRFISHNTSCRTITHRGSHCHSAWCSEIGSLTSLDACNSGASSDVREPISLHHTLLSVQHCSIP